MPIAGSPRAVRINASPCAVYGTTSFAILGPPRRSTVAAAVTRYDGMSSLNFFAHHASTTNFWLSPLGSTVLGSFHTSERRGGVERRQLELKGIEGGDRKRGVMGGERRRQKSLRIGVHHANAVVWEPV